MLGKLSEKYEMLELKIEKVESKCEDEVEDVRRLVEVLSAEVEDVQQVLPSGGGFQPLPLAHQTPTPHGSQIVEEHQQDNSLGINESNQTTGAVKCKGTFVGHQGTVWCLATHGNLLFSGSSDHSIKVWDTFSTYKCVATLSGHAEKVLALCCVTLASTEQPMLYTGSADNTIKVWSIGQFSLMDTLQGHDNHVCTLAAASNKGLLFSGSLKSIKVWDIADEHKERAELQSGVSHWVRALCTCDTYLYSGSHTSVTLWSLASLSCVAVLETSGGSVYSLALTQDHILSGTHDACIHVWQRLDVIDNIQESEETIEEKIICPPRSTLRGHEGTVYALAVLPPAAAAATQHEPPRCKVVSASYDRSLRVWSVAEMALCQTLVRHQGSVACLTTARGLVFSGAVDGTVKVWQ